MSDTSPLRLALVGCGQIAGAHLRAIAATAGARLTWTQDVDPERARAAAAGRGEVRWTGSFDAVLGADDVDAVVLCLPHHLHEPFAVQAAAAGKHILVEKPMAMDEGEARRMVDAAEATGVTLSVGQSTRCQPGWLRARRLVGEGAVGAVRHVLHQRLFYIDRVTTDWRRVQEECGGLYLPLFGSHDVDAVLWVMSAATSHTPALPCRVWASLRAHSQASGGDSDGAVVLDFADGRLATFQFSVCSRRERTETIFVGADGTLAVDRTRVWLNGEELDAASTAAATSPAADSWDDAFARQMGQFVAALRGQGPVPAPGRQVLPVMRVLDLARLASDTGTPQAF